MMNEDNIIKTLVEAAIDICEKYTECAILDAIFEVRYTKISRECVMLPVKNAKEVLKVSYQSIGSSENEILKPRYYKMLNNILYISQSNNAYQLSVEYKAGLANEFKDLPSMIQLIIIEHVSHLYENRGMDKDFDIKKYDMLRNVKI